MKDSIIERNGLNCDALSPADICMKLCLIAILAEQSPDCHVEDVLFMCCEDFNPCAWN